MMVSPQQFRRVMGCYATGVTVVTAETEDGKPAGLTVNSFTSVSLTPPLVLFCVGHGSANFETMRRAKHFAVNILAEEQEALSRRFAARSGDRFAGVAYRDGSYGCPLIEGCLGFVECRRVATHPYGDHTIVIGEVLAAEAREGRPLLYYESDYARLERGAAESGEPA